MSAPTTGPLAPSPLSEGTHVTEIDGVEQCYHVHGTGPVCVVHPGGPGIEWKYLRMPALEEHLTMVYLEPIGTGASGRLDDPKNYRLDVYTRFVHGLINHLAQPKVFLLGHSHGGFVATRYALDHPERLAGVILYEGSPVTGPEFGMDAMANLTAFAQRFPEQPEAVAMPQTFMQAQAATSDAEFTTGLRQLLPAYLYDYWADEEKWAALQDSLYAWIDPQRGEDPKPYDLRPELGSIALPTLILVGVRDFICGPRWAAMLHEGIPGSQLTVFEASGHMAHLEEPEAFARAVTDFTTRG